MEREQWGSRFGILCAFVANIVGLGNIWRFPYVAGMFGGGAFILPWIIAVFIVGFVILICETTMGKKAQGAIVESFRHVGGKYWAYVGWYMFFVLFVVMLYYNVVAGWVLYYAGISITGGMFAADSFIIWEEFADSWKAVVAFIMMMLLVGSVLWFGIQKGIERTCKFLTPAIFVLLIVAAIRSVTLPGGLEGVNFYLRPDFGLILRDPTYIAYALGQVFWSTAIGFGLWHTYGSYIKRDGDTSLTSITTVLGDASGALLAGFAVLPAVIAFGIEPASGVELSFLTLPRVFAEMPLGRLMAPVFFIALFFAALTSVIGALEPIVATLMEEWNMSRKRIVTIVIVVFTLGGTYFLLDYTRTGLVDLTIGTFGPILAGLGSIIVCAYVWGARNIRDYINEYGDIQMGWWFVPLAKYVAPGFIIALLLYYLWVIWLVPIFS